MKLLPGSARDTELRNVTILGDNGRRTSIRIEGCFWVVLEDIIVENRQCKNMPHSINELCTMLDSERGDMSLTSALRCYILSGVAKWL